MRTFLRAVCAVSALGAFLPACARAETGVSDAEIVIGSCLALSGPTKDLGGDYLTGAKAYLDYLNAEKGGVLGRKIKLVSMDDAYEPDKAISCFKDLLGVGIFAAAFSVGSPTSAKYVPMAQASGVPILGFSSGPQFIYEPLNRYVFAVRASYSDETRAEVEHLWNDLGLRRIGVVFQEDAFGASGLDGVKKALAARGANPVAIGSYKRNTVDVAEALEKVKAADPEAVILVAVAKPAAEFLKKARALRWKPLFVMVAGRDNELVKFGAEAVEGVVLAQPVPLVSQTEFPTVVLYRKVLKRYAPSAVPGGLSLQSFVDAMILTEGLKLAGKELTRDKFISAVESLRDLDMGLGPEMRVQYSPADHKAFEKLFFAVIRGGKGVPLTNWKSLRRKP